MHKILSNEDMVFFLIPTPNDPALIEVGSFEKVDMTRHRCQHGSIEALSVIHIPRSERALLIN